MRMRTRLALPVLALAMLTACNAAAKTPGATTPGAATSSASSGCPTTLTITAADSSRTDLCVALGGTVTVQLQAVAASHWLPIDSDGTALAPAAITPAQPAGAQAAAFTAVARGTAKIMSSRPNCPGQPGQTGVSCHSIMAWQVSVEVK